MLTNAQSIELVSTKCTLSNAADVRMNYVACIGRVQLIHTN